MKKIMLFIMLALSPIFAASSQDRPTETQGFLAKSVRDTFDTSRQAIAFTLNDPAASASLVTSFVPLIFVGAMLGAQDFTTCMAWACGVFISLYCSSTSEKHAKIKAPWFTGTVNLARSVDCFLVLLMLGGKFFTGPALD